jgi:CDP-diacylglycerol--glycerol-3-phosphate 3-phosphatidyltransferase
MKFANLITCSRIFLIIPIIWFSSQGGVLGNTMALVLFVLAASTDYLDGYVARKTNSESSLGALLDLLADKLLVCILLVWIIFLQSTLMVFLPATVIIAREIIISFARQYLSEKSTHVRLKVSKLGKLKTTFQLISVGFLLLTGEDRGSYYFLAVGLIWFSAILSVLSLYKYATEWGKEL